MVRISFTTSTWTTFGYGLFLLHKNRWCYVGRVPCLFVLDPAWSVNIFLTFLRAVLRGVNRELRTDSHITYSATDRHGISCGDTGLVLMKSRFVSLCCEQKYVEAVSSDDENIDDGKES
jgi:hypothetical protein